MKSPCRRNQTRASFDFSIGRYKHGEAGFPILLSKEYFAATEASCLEPHLLLKAPAIVLAEVLADVE